MVVAWCSSWVQEPVFLSYHTTNWWRVLDTAERSRVDQGKRAQRLLLGSLQLLQSQKVVEFLYGTASRKTLVVPSKTPGKHTVLLSVNYTTAGGSSGTSTARRLMRERQSRSSMAVAERHKPFPQSCFIRVPSGLSKSAACRR